MIDIYQNKFSTITIYKGTEFTHFRNDGTGYA